MTLFCTCMVSQVLKEKGNSDVYVDWQQASNWSAIYVATLFIPKYSQIGPLASKSKVICS